MRKKRWKYLFAAAALVLGTDVAQTQDWIARTDAGVVRIIVDQGDGSGVTGTGWVVASGGYIVTNYHVAAGVPGRIIVANQTQRASAVIVAASAAHDLAILRADVNLAPLKISSALPAKGGDVIAIGFPGAADAADYNDISGAVESTVTSGKVGRVFDGQMFSDDSEEGYAKTTWIQHSAAISGGNSGGPLFDACGRVVGINAVGLNGEIADASGTVVVPQGIQFSIPVQNLVALVDARRLGISLDLDNSPCNGAPSPGAATPALDKPQAEAPNTGLYVAAAGLIFVFALMLIALRQSRPAPAPAPAAAPESYTQYVRRTGAPPAGARPAQVDWMLQGHTSKGVPVELRLGMGDEAFLGRSSGSSDLVIDDPTVSRRHLAIKAVRGGFEIRDLGSSNGTRVDGRALGTKPLLARGGERIEIGRAQLRIKKITR